MKGFNIAPQPGSSSTLLEPVAELIASWKEVQHENSHHEIFGSTRSEIFGLGTMPKKSLHHSNACRQTRGARSSSKKKRWDTLIEAAKAHKVSKKFISKILAIDRFKLSFNNWIEVKRRISLVHQVGLVPRIPFIHRHPKMVARDRKVQPTQNLLWKFTVVTMFRVTILITVIIPITRKVITLLAVSV